MHVRHKVDRIWLVHHIECILLEPGQIAHVALEQIGLQPVVFCHPSVLRQLFVGEVKHRNLRAEQAERGRLLTAATGQKQHPLTAHVAEQTGLIHHFARRNFVQFQLGPRIEYAGANQPVPAFTIDSR